MGTAITNAMSVVMSVSRMSGRAPYGPVPEIHCVPVTSLKPYSWTAGHAVETTLHTKMTMTAPKNIAAPRSRYLYGRSEVAERRILSATSEPPTGESTSVLLMKVCDFNFPSSERLVQAE